jgi:hypothetical protein
MNNNAKKAFELIVKAVNEGRILAGKLQRHKRKRRSFKGVTYVKEAYNTEDNLGLYDQVIKRTG